MLAKNLNRLRVNYFQQINSPQSPHPQPNEEGLRNMTALVSRTGSGGAVGQMISSRTGGGRLPGNQRPMQMTPTNGNPIMQPGSLTINDNHLSPAPNLLNNMSETPSERSSLHNPVPDVQAPTQQVQSFHPPTRASQGVAGNNLFRTQNSPPDQLISFGVTVQNNQQLPV